MRGGKASSYSKWETVEKLGQQHENLVQFPSLRHSNLQERSHSFRRRTKTSEKKPVAGALPCRLRDFLFFLVAFRICLITFACFWMWFKLNVKMLG